MPRMSDRQSVGANAVVANVLAGKLHEFLSEDSIVRLYAVAAAVGLNVSLLVGGESIVQDQEVSGAGGFPVIPDHFIAEGAGFAGDRLVLSLRNTTGAAIVATTIVDTEPIA